MVIIPLPSGLTPYRWELHLPKDYFITVIVTALELIPSRPSYKVMPKGTLDTASCPKQTTDTPIHTTIRLLHTWLKELRFTYLRKAVDQQPDRRERL